MWIENAGRRQLLVGPSYDGILDDLKCERENVHGPNLLSSTDFISQPGVTGTADTTIRLQIDFLFPPKH